MALGKIRKLYTIGKRIESLDEELKRQQRQALNLPLLEALNVWLEKNSRRVVKNNLACKAIKYTLNQQETLIRYCEDDQLNISNALAENLIRPFAAGRRDWLFANTPRGAHTSPQSTRPIG